MTTSAIETLAASDLARAAADQLPAGFLFPRLGQRAINLFSAALEPFGLRPREFAVLAIVAQAEGCPQQAVSDALSIDSGNLVAVIDSLEQAGRLKRKRHPNDRRRHNLVVTKQGITLLEAARPAVESTQRELFSPLDANERRQCESMLKRLAHRDDGS